jgi:hypothetical protein
MFAPSLTLLLYMDVRMPRAQDAQEGPRASDAQGRGSERHGRLLLLSPPPPGRRGEG